MDEYSKIKKSGFILIKELIPYEEEHGNYRIGNEVLQLFMCETLAKRVSSIVLIAVGMPLFLLSRAVGVKAKSLISRKQSWKR